MPFYESGDLRLHYVCRGAPLRQTSTAIVFQHGIGGDVRQPSRFLVPERTSIPAEELSIVHADFRGHGQSDLGHTERLSIETLANDLVALLDHLKLAQAIVGGISMGAAAALRLAVQQPERCQALILCRPAWADGPMSAVARHSLGLVAELLADDDWQRSAAPSLEQSEILHSVEKVCPDAAKSLRGQVQSVLARPESREAAIVRLRQLPLSRGLNDLGDLAAVTCPTLLLAAQGDPVHPFECARQLALSLPHGHLVQIAPKSPLDDSAHLEEVDRLIGDFLRARSGSDDREGGAKKNTTPGAGSAARGKK